MSISRKILKAAAGLGRIDPFFNQTTLLLHGDGTSGGQNNTFLDSSANNFTITRNGNTTQGSFSPYAPSGVYSTTADGGSGYFDGTGDYLVTPIASELQFGAGDFTIEGWINVPSVDATYRCIFSIGPPVQIYARSGTIEVYFNDGDNTSTYIVNGTTGPASSISTNTWAHFAVVRNGTTFTVYVDGVAGTPATGVSASVATSATAPAVGIYLATTAFPYTGYISDVRIIKGTALYTSAFTPPTAPLTAVSGTELLCNFTNAAIFDSTAKNVLETVGNAQIDTAVKKYGTGSMEFDGTGDYLQTLNGTSLGSGDFTIEGWVNFNSVSQDSFVSTREATGGSSTGVLFAAYLSKLQVFTAGAFQLTSTTTLSTGVWYHVAMVRSSGTSTLYLNGVDEDTYADSNNYTSSRIYVGGDVSGTYNLDGYIDDLRITKGVARYTAAFTPPDRAFPDQ